MQPGTKIRNFIFLEKIGSGNFSDVWKAVETETNNSFAIKILFPEKVAAQPKILQLMQSEIKVLQECCSENIVKLYEYFEHNGVHHIVIEFCDGGDLENYINSKPKERINEEETIAFLKQLLNGFKEFHRINVIHRDFKLENVLLHDGVLKIADLGFCKQTANLTKTTLGTRGYMAPEVMKYQPYDNKVDIWALGVCLYRMIYGDLPYNSQNQYDMLQKMNKYEINFNVKGVECSKGLQELIKKMLNPNPKKRIDWMQVYHDEVLNKSRVNSKIDKLGSFIIPMKKNDVILEHQNLIFQKNKAFYKEQSKFENFLDNDISLMVKQNSNQCSEISNKMSFIEKDPPNIKLLNSGESILNTSYHMSQNNQKQTNYNEIIQDQTFCKPDINEIKAKELSEQYFKSVINEKNLSFTQSQIKKADKSSIIVKEKSEQYFATVVTNKELDDLRQENEEKIRELTIIENLYLYSRNIISRNAKILEDEQKILISKGTAAKDIQMCFQLILAKKILFLSRSFFKILQLRKNEFKLDQKYFESFVKTPNFERIMLTFQENVIIYEDYYHSLLLDITDYVNNKNTHMKNILDQEKIEFLQLNDTEKMNEINDKFKEIIIEYLISERTTNKEIMIHMIELIDLFNYKEKLLFDGLIAGGYDFWLYEFNLNFQDESYLNILLEQKIQDFMDDN